MKYTFENGKEKLIRQMGTIVLTDITSGNYCYAKLNYMSCHGMYFETECAFKPGDIINIQFNNAPMKGASKIYSANVKWCMLLSEDESICKYGVGAKYFEPNNLESARAANLIQPFESNSILNTG